MTFMQRILTLGATGLAAVAIASPALAQEGEEGKSPPSPTTSSPTTYCRDSTAHAGEGDVVTSDQGAPSGFHECESGEAAGYREAREQRRQREAAAREAQDRKFQAAVAREQAEADQLEEQAKLCQQQPSRAGCGIQNSSVQQAKPAPPPKPVPYAAAQQERVARYGNPAGVEIRPVVKRPEDAGLEDAIDVPDSDQLALIDPAARPNPRNLVWFTVVALAAISSLGYGLWRVLFLGDV